MSLSRVRATVAIALLLAPLAILAAACSRPPEQQLLTQFFRAARARDNATLAMMSAVTFDPREQGSVESFDITNVSEERRTPLDLEALMAAERKAREEEAAFSKRKREYQDANLTTIEQVLKLEREPTPRMSAGQAKVKADWDKWRADTSVYAKATSSARSALIAASGPVEASLTQPGQPRFDPAQFKGELITKDVTVDARVRSPEGEVSQKTLTVTFQRAVGTMGDQERTGRWIITAIRTA